MTLLRTILEPLRSLLLLVVGAVTVLGIVYAAGVLVGTFLLGVRLMVGG